MSFRAPFYHRVGLRLPRSQQGTATFMEPAPGTPAAYPVGLLSPASRGKIRPLPNGPISDRRHRGDLLATRAQIEARMAVLP